MSEKVAVVILNYNGQRYLEKFLPIVIQHTPEAKIIVADNNSSDNSVEFVLKTFPSVQLIVLDKNYGFCEGYNRALAQIDAEYYVLLNSDIEVTPCWLSPLIQLMETNPRIGACQPTLLAWHHRNEFEYAGAAGGFLDILGYPFCRGRIFHTLEEYKKQYSTAPIFWASGACLCVRAQLYHQLGGLEKLFFAHMEEIDFCWRLQNYGFAVWHCAESIVYHVGGGTLHKTNPQKTFLNFRNGLALLFKNLPISYLFPVIFARLILDGIAGIQFLFNKKFSDTWAILRAHFAFYQMIPQLWKIRTKSSTRSLKNAYPSLFYRVPIVWKYFIEQKKYFSELDFNNFNRAYFAYTKTSLYNL
ncbi:MAG: glycosyltransferase family 2 protein [Cytophagales bacterium]|nr:glycosyltransferase family 2 protein [Cytophagales bacterium]MDW8383207.1 glycosyltransferase family 2 protein [Flammeovirgaceae bacterium]